MTLPVDGIAPGSAIVIKYGSVRSRGLAIGVRVGGDKSWRCFVFRAGRCTLEEFSIAWLSAGHDVDITL